MFEKKIFIWDIDGTIANCEWRQHHLQKKPKDWVKFREGTRSDGTHDDILWLFKLLAKEGHTNIFVTARTEMERADTEWWFENVAGITKNMYVQLYMRGTDDYRDDFLIKREVLQTIRKKYGEPFMVFEDRARVVQMWRSEGVRCMHVESGDF